MAEAFDWGLLEPAGPDGQSASDDRVLEAMVAFESAYLAAWSDLLGLSVDAVLDGALLDARLIDRGELLAASRLAGAPVIGLVQVLRKQVGEARGLVHQGLTSQDVVDSALMLVSRDALRVARRDLVSGGEALLALAREHKSTPLLAKTLMQEAEPTTLGAALASWLDGVTSAVNAVDAVEFPVQLGGAVGIGEAFPRISARADAVATLRGRLSQRLSLADPGRCWHTERTPVLAVVGAAALVCTTAGRIGRDLGLLARDGVVTPLQGGASSAMPHKRNPVDAIILTANGLRIGGMVATVHAAALSYDARPAGEWHAAWQDWRGSLRLAEESAAVLAHAVAHARIDPPAATASSSALDAAGAVVEAAISRFQRSTNP